MGEHDDFQVLIVEDELIPAAYLKTLIERHEGFRVIDTVTSARAARERIAAHPPHVVFVDIMIAGPVSGAELATEIHAAHPDILIIFATAYSDDEMLEYAAESDAFAYLLKPYRPQGIQATLTLAKTRLRRSTAPTMEDLTIQLIDGFAYDTQTHTLARDGQEIFLSPKEHRLMEILCKNNHIVVDKASVQEALELSEDSLRSLVYRIRQKTNSNLIRSIKRFGYTIAKESM